MSQTNRQRILAVLDFFTVEISRYENAIISGIDFCPLLFPFNDINFSSFVEINFA